MNVPIRPSRWTRSAPQHGCHLSTALRLFALWWCVLLIGTTWVGPAAAQTSITVDPATAFEAAGSSFSFNHTVVTGSNRYLIVSVAIERDDATVTSVTYAGQPLTFLGRVTDAGRGATLDLWGRVAPTSGTNQTVVTLSNSAAVVVGAKSFANVAQTNPISGSFFIGNGTIASGTIATSANQLVLATLAANDEVNSVTVGAGQTSRYNVVNAADVIGAASTKPVSAGSTSMSYLLASSGRWVLAVIALQPANPFVVTNTNDSGAGSLRAAIDAANANPGADTITFAIPGAGPHTITLSSVLATLTDDGTVIDGTTQAGTQCRDLWLGSGHDLRINVRGNGAFQGFRLAGANQTVRGLSLSGFDSAVVFEPGGSGATLHCTYLGLLADGSTNANSWTGVNVFGAGGRIGGLGSGEGNVISASNTGVRTNSGSTDTAIRGNFIGTDAAGMTTRPNSTAINHWNGVGTWGDITHNLIAGNTNAGIVLETDDLISPSTDFVRVQRNRIGFTRDLSALMRNGGDGIRFPAGSISNVLIGGEADTQGNVITGTVEGISLSNTPNIVIQGNVIARSGQNGVRVTAANGVTIGGDSATLGNIIGGNGFSGIAATDESSNIAIRGNTIGAVTIAGGTFENQDQGIFLRDVSNVTIGDGTAGGRNVMARNGLQAILGLGILSNIAITGNFIGTDASGNVPVSNAFNADPFNRDAVNLNFATITNLSILNNIIGGHDAALVTLWGASGNGFTLQGNSLGVGADGVSQLTFSTIEPLLHIGGGTSVTNILIGGGTTGQGNSIAFGGGAGIELDMTAGNAQIIGNTIRDNVGSGIILLGAAPSSIIANRIFENGQLGIDLNLDGVTPNDAGDVDSGPNDRLNFPEIAAINIVGANQLTYSFTLDVPADPIGYRIEFFASSAADPSGHGEGERFLGHADITHAGGSQSYTGTLTTLEPVSIGDVISATTTRRTIDGSWDITSEFSAVATADGLAALMIAMTSEVFDPPADNPFATPGNDILLTTTVSNTGTGSTDADSLFAVISLDPAHSFLNAATPAFGGVVAFASDAPALAFDPANDLAFSSAAIAPTSMAQCTYTPVTDYDPLVRHVCLNPKGTLPSGGPEGEFTVQLRARIN